MTSYDVYIVKLGPLVRPVLMKKPKKGRNLTLATGYSSKRRASMDENQILHGI